VSLSNGLSRHASFGAHRERRRKGAARGMAEIYAFDFLSLPGQDPLLQFKEANFVPRPSTNPLAAKENPLHGII